MTRLFKTLGVLGDEGMEDAFIWVHQEDIDEEGSGPIFASLLYG